MKNVGEVLEKMSSFYRGKPAFSDPAEWLAFQTAEGVKRNAEVAERLRRDKVQRLFSRSGISALHRECSFDNYQVSCAEQGQALEKARGIVRNFASTGGFVFSGKPGTGKNHLAAAICNALLDQGKSVMIVTLADIMTSLKSTFRKDAGSDEAEMLDAYAALDLLVIDEIGVQHNTRYEQVVISQIVDRRSCAKCATGMLTNLNFTELSGVLGERVINRMKMAGIWLTFNWQSYRANVTF